MSESLSVRAGAKSFPSEFGEWGVDLSAGDRSVAPGDDFFRFVNGRWFDQFELPADKASYGAFHALHDKSEEQVYALLNELIDARPAPDSPAQKVRDFYQSFMDQQRVDALGLMPITPILEKIKAISSSEDLIAAFAASGIDGTYSPIGWGVNADAKNPDEQILTIGYGSLSLPDRDYYLQDLPHFQKLREAFLGHIAKMLSFAGKPEGEAQADAEAILALETRLANAHWPRAETRDADKTYNIYLYQELCAEFSTFDWEAFFDKALLPRVKKLNVSAPSAIGPVIECINETPLAQWRAYLTYKLIAGAANFLSDEIGAANFEFYGRGLQGQPERLPRWKRGVGAVSAFLGEAVGQLYVERHFPPNAKAQMDALVANVMAAFGERIEKASWMSEETRAVARKKLATFLPKIGYPDKWEDYSPVTIKTDGLFGNVMRLRRFHYEKRIEGLGKPTDRAKWFMTPQTVNAYYHPLFNEIVFSGCNLTSSIF